MSEKLNYNPADYDDPSLVNNEESSFHLAELESYYDRQVLKMGSGVLDLVNNSED